MSSAPLRFLGIAIIAWVGLRTAGDALALPPLPAIAVPPAAALLPPEPSLPDVTAAPSPEPAAYPAPPVQPMAYPYPVAVPVSVPAARSVRYAEAALPERGYRFAPSGYYQEASFPLLGDLPAPAATPAPAVAAPRSTPSFTPAMPKAFDRLSLTSWALMRQNSTMAVPVGGPVPLASSGQLGQSQAGARLTYRINRSLALNLRVSAPMQQQGAANGEAALGVSWQPMQSLPVRLLAERRKAFGLHGGRDAFALLAEGGVYDRPLPWNFRLDGYAQAGVVGLRTRDLFADAGFTATRPFKTRLALGGGIWGGMQPGLSRLEVGPRASLWLNPRIRAHLDYRLRLLGNAQPGSGPALTVGANF